MMTRKLRKLQDEMGRPINIHWGWHYVTIECPKTDSEDYLLLGIGESLRGALRKARQTAHKKCDCCGAKL